MKTQSIGSWFGVMELPALSVEARREFFQIFQSQLTSIGHDPNDIAVIADGFPTNWRSFTRMRKRLEKVDWATVNSLSLRSSTEADPYGLVCVYFNSQISSRRDRHSVCWVIKADIISIDGLTLISRWIEEARAIEPACYAYAGGDVSYSAAHGYAIGLRDGTDGRSNDAHLNLQEWPSKPRSRMLLRDVFAVNYFTESQLRLRVNDESLLDWVQADRGELTALDKHCWRWRPEIARIPEYRENLFRAGILYFWRYFTISPLIKIPREFETPLLSGEEIPEIYRTEFFAGKNPYIPI